MSYYNSFYGLNRQNNLHFVQDNIKRRYLYGYNLSKNNINHNNINFNNTNIKKRPKSNTKFLDSGISSRGKNYFYNKSNSKQKTNLNKIGYNNDNQINNIIKYNFDKNENKKESSLQNNPLYYDENGKNKTINNSILKNDIYSKRFIYGGRDFNYYDRELPRLLFSKTEKNYFNNEQKDNQFYSTFNRNLNDKNLTNIYPKKTDFPKYYLDSNLYNNKIEKEYNYFKDKIINNEEDIYDKNENKKDDNNLTIKNNSINPDIKYQEINYKYNINNNFEKLSYNKEINNNKENNNENNNSINKNNKINSIDVVEDKNKKDIELISATSKDFLDEEISPKSIAHHRPNKPQSKSVDPLKKSSFNEVILITTSLVGLNNLGLTCYMNSALQNIIHCKKLIEKILLYKSKTNTLPSLTNSFINLCYSLASKKISNERNYISSYTFCLNYFSPNNFKDNFCSLHKDYKRGQHDSIEFLRTLLDDISKEININNNISAYKELTTEGKSKIEQNKEYHNFFLSRENSIIIDIFYIQMINIFTCQCGYESYSFQKLLDIPLLLTMKTIQTDLISLIKEYLKEEAIDWSSKCEKCKKENVKHYKKIKFSMINDIIIFSLQRFDPFYSKKSTIYVSYNEYLDLKEFCDNDLYKEKTRYRLCGTINHEGSINSGHYFAYVRIGEIWYEFNDSFVKKINNMDYTSRSVCVLFYEKE